MNSEVNAEPVVVVQLVSDGFAACVIVRKVLAEAEAATSIAATEAVIERFHMLNILGLCPCLGLHAGAGA